MSGNVDIARAEALAREAMAWMAQRGVPPTAQNFEVILAYLGRENPALRAAIDALIARESPFDAAAMSDLHAKFFAGMRMSDALGDVSASISAELNSLLKLLHVAGRDQSAYGSALSKASGELSGANVPAAKIKAVVQHVVQATHAMEARSKMLEMQAETSSREVNVLRERLETVRREALTDGLTGIANRKAFDSELAHAMAHAIETRDPLSLLMCDIDHFKQFNDTWGHQTGDQVLKLVAHCLAENVKGRDTAARFGGEEFAIVLPQTELGDAVRLANQIRAKVESKKLVKRSNGNILGKITISIGVAQYDRKESADAFVQRADACLYAAKRGGRNRVASQPEGKPGKTSAA